MNYVLEKRTLTDQIISLFSSIIPNNFTQVFIIDISNSNLKL